jgi:hypothetical protein
MSKRGRMVRAAVSYLVLGSEPTEQAKSGARYIFLTDQEPLRARANVSNRPITRVAWRVLAANNRPLGRSATPFNSLLECHTAALTLHQRVAEISSAVLFYPVDGHWRWTVSLDGVPVAEQVHLYQRRVEANRAVKQFLTAVSAVCPIADEVRPSGQRAMMAYDRIEAGSR